jgi:hypothetical protein
MSDVVPLPKCEIEILNDKDKWEDITEHLSKEKKKSCDKK